MKEIIIGSRGSDLALKQAQIVLNKLKISARDYNFKLKKISTKGDQITDKSFSDIGGSGLFTKEIEYHLMAERIDLAVHSLKDLPTCLDPRLEVGAVLKRANPKDVLISKAGLNLEQLSPGAIVGTGSARRKAELLNYRPDLDVHSIRGNVDTRLEKLKNETYDAIVLAAAGLERMGWEDKISQFLDPNKFIPAAGQGAIAIEIRAEDKRTKKLIKTLNDFTTKVEVKAERAMYNFLNAGCKEPLAAYAKWRDDSLSLTGMVANLAGNKMIKDRLELATAEIKNDIAKTEKLGVKLAQNLLAQGADEILNKLRGD